MLSYQHGYHAGNFADVHKHLILTLTLDYLLQKDKPLACLDLYAGAGEYDLDDPRATKTAEAGQGVRRLPATGWPAAAMVYRRVLGERALLTGLRQYPGSPAIAARLLRDQDRLILNELHGSENAQLRRLFHADQRVHCHQRDALEALSALLPPAEKRGLVLLDPSYEVKSDYQQLPAALLGALGKWPQAVMLLWYPLLAGGLQQPMLRQLERQLSRPWLRSELSVRPVGIGMHGSGMLIVNPPWTLAQQLQSCRPLLAALQQEGGDWRLESHDPA